MSTFQINDTVGKASRLVDAIAEELDKQKTTADETGEEPPEELMDLLERAHAFADSVHKIVNHIDETKMAVVAAGAADV